MTEDARPAIEQLLARLCGGVITGKDYVGYFLNEHGEELVFAQRWGEKAGRLWHSVPTGSCSASTTIPYGSAA